VNPNHKLEINMASIYSEALICERKPQSRGKHREASSVPKRTTDSACAQLNTMKFFIG